MKNPSTKVREFKSVRGLLASPKRWCRYHLASDYNGFRVSVQSSSAAKFCLIGACQKIYPDPERRSIALQKLGAVYKGSLSSFNDSHDHADVIALVRKANI